MTAITGTKDMTRGNPVRLLLAFSMPLMLGNLFQQLYTFVDALIVGQCVSANALAALGATEWLTFIMFGVISGMTQGCSIVIARFFGKKKIDLLRQAIYGGTVLAQALAAIYCVIALSRIEVCRLGKESRVISLFPCCPASCRYSCG